MWKRWFPVLLFGFTFFLFLLRCWQHLNKMTANPKFHILKSILWGKMSSLSTLWFLNLLLLLTFLMTSLFLGKDYYRERKGLVMVTIWKELNWTHLSLALDLRPLLKPLAVPRECSTRILNIKRKEISLQGTQSKYRPN